MIVIGNSANRRVTMFQAALTAQGHPPARIVEWIDLCEPGAPAELLAGYDLVRMESPSEDSAVERAMIRRGEAAARGEHVSVVTPKKLALIPEQLGRILYPRQHHLGFLAVLAEIEAATTSARVVPRVPAIRELFDKRAASEHWRGLGIPMAESLPGVRDPDQLRASMRTHAWPSVYVKLTSGNSASCLALFMHDEAGESVITTIEDNGRARFNAHQLQHLTERAPIDRVLGFILAEGAIVERAIPSAQLEGRYFDLRVLVIDGVAAFTELRTASQPITSLDRGGARGEVAAFQRLVSAAAWDAAMASCVAVQAATGAFQVCVDVVFEPDLEHHRVIGADAFGDLLPDLERDGLDVYGWQIKRLLGTLAP